MNWKSVLALVLLSPLGRTQEDVPRSPYEKLLPGQPFVEVQIREPARFWKELVKSRVGLVLASDKMTLLRRAIQGSFELQLLYSTLGAFLGYEKQASNRLFQKIIKLDGSLRFAYLPSPGFGGWVCELDGKPQTLEGIRKDLFQGFGESHEIEGAKISMLGREVQVHRQKGATWRFLEPILSEGKLYFAAWRGPVAENPLPAFEDPWKGPGGRRFARSLLAQRGLDLQVVVDLRAMMAELKKKAEGVKEGGDEFVQFAKLLAFYETQVLRLGVEVKRGRIVQALRAEVLEGGRFAKVLGAIFPREGRAVDLIAFQPEGVRTSALISVDMPVAYAEVTRIIEQGMAEFDGEAIDIEDACEGLFGFSMKNDLIAPLDGRICFFEGDETDKKNKTGFCLGIGTTNSKKTREVVEALFNAAGMTKQDDAVHAGVEITQYDFSFLWAKVKLRYCLTKTFFLLAYDERGYRFMRDVIDSEKRAEDQRFRPTGDLKAQLMLVPQESATLIWADTARAMTSLLEAWASDLGRVLQDPEQAKTPGTEPSRKVQKSLAEGLGEVLSGEGLSTTLTAWGRDRTGFWVRWIW